MTYRQRRLRVLKIARLLAVVFSIPLLAPIAFGGSIALDTTRLPSTQGWSFYTDTGLPEANFFSIAGGTLVQNTLGIGGGSGQGYASYGMPDVITTGGPFWISARAKLTAEEYFDNHNGFGFAGQVGNRYYVFGIGDGEVAINDQQFSGINTRVFHDYVLAVAASGGFSLYLDGSLALTGPSIYVPNGNFLYFGDGTQGANASGIWASFEYSDSPPIPEPQTTIPTLVGVGLLVWRWRRHGQEELNG
jgi:hypothetical protein